MVVLVVVQVFPNTALQQLPREEHVLLIGELGEAELYEGGLTIRATIDPELQALAARALRRGLEAYDRGRAVYRGPVARIQPVADGDTGAFPPIGGSSQTVGTGSSNWSAIFFVSPG